MRTICKKLYAKECDDALAELDEKAGITEDNDARSRARDSAERLGKLIDDGIRIHSALDAPDDVQVLFEPIEMKYLSKKEMMKIEEKEDDGKDGD